MYNQFELVVDGIPQTYNLGDVLTIKNNKLQKASCSNIEDSEAIGIIKKIKQKLDETLNTPVTESISVVFNGMVEWDYDPSNGDIGLALNIEKRSFSSDNPSFTAVFPNQVLIYSQTYFLGTEGTLIDFDPADEAGFDQYVSKPMLVANGFIWCSSKLSWTGLQSRRRSE